MNRKGFGDLIVYQKARLLALEVFKISNGFPKEEKYSLTDQIRRSSRSIGANIAEAWPKRRYPKSFVSKLIDAQSESCETLHWIEIALECNYLVDSDVTLLYDIISEIQKMLSKMTQHPEKFCR